MPDFERPTVPDTPHFLDELEGRLRIEAADPPARPLRVPRWSSDWIMQRYLMPVGMSAMAFVVAAAFLAPGFGSVSQPASTSEAPPASTVVVDEPGSSGPTAAPAEPATEPHLIDGRFSLSDFASARAADMDDAVRSFVR